jgi:hypothetical protein
MLHFALTGSVCYLPASNLPAKTSTAFRTAVQEGSRALRGDDTASAFRHVPNLLRIVRAVENQ